MKDFIFISDFDKTITKKDFYWILLDDFIGKKGIDYYHEWKKTKKIGTQFLNTIFTWHQFSEEERVAALNTVEIDKDLDKVTRLIASQGGDFLILSAGFDYYINYVLDQNNLGQIPVITNRGYFRNNTFLMDPDVNSPYYSPVYGVDKGKVVLDYKSRYKKVYFAGDSEPDYYAAIHADMVFAKNELATILKEKGIHFFLYESFEDIYLQLMKL